MYHADSVPKVREGYRRGEAAHAPTTGERERLPGFYDLKKLEGEEGLEQVIDAMEANDIRFAEGRGNRNGPCLVYLPVEEGKAGFHELDIKKTQRLSRGWTKKELQPVLNKVPKTKTYTEFNYKSFAEALAARQSANKG